MIDEQEYRQQFRKSVNGLIKAGKHVCADLVPEDVIGAYVAAMTSLASKNLPAFDVARLLRAIADTLDEKQSNRTMH